MLFSDDAATPFFDRRLPRRDILMLLTRAMLPRATPMPRYAAYFDFFFFFFFL